MRRLYQLVLLILFCATSAYPQFVRRDDIVLTTTGTPARSAVVRVCQNSATGTPCSPLASIFNDTAGTMPLANPVPVDSNGNYHLYADPTAKYQIQISGPGINGTITIPDVTLPMDANIPSFAAALVIKVASNQIILGVAPNQTTINAPAPSGNVTVNLPSTGDTLVGRVTTDTLSGKSFAQNLLPDAAGTRTVGSAALPFSSLFVGGAATNNFNLTGTATAARTITFPDATGTLPLPSFAQTWTATQTFSLPPVPSSAGGAAMGTAALPWSSIFIGGAATNNIQITGTATAARVFTLPDANSNPVQPFNVVANQFLTSISSAGLVTAAQPSFSNISGTATTGQLPAATVYNNATNTFTSAGTIDLSAASATAGFKVPVAAGAAPTASGAIAYDSTANQFNGGVNAANQKFAMLGLAQTWTANQTNVPLVTPTIGGGSALTRFNQITVTLTCSSISANTASTQSFTVTGVQAADKVVAVWNAQQSGNFSYQAYRATAANTVAIDMANNSGVPATPSCGSITFLLFQ